MEPTVAAQVRVELAESRRRGIDFEEAWTSAVGDAPEGFTHIDAWSTILQVTKRAWRDAYERRPAGVDVRRVEKLHELWMAR